MTEFLNRNQYIEFKSERIASNEEMLRLFEASGAIHYDLFELDKAEISDLDMGQVAEYFTRYHISFLEESEEERQRLMLHADILGQNNKPTVAGLLIFGLSPERIFPASGISFAHFSGRDIVEKLIDKKIFSVSCRCKLKTVLPP